MTHVFYAFAIIVLLWELQGIFRPQRMEKLTELFKKQNKDAESLDVEENVTIVTTCAFALLYGIWSITGLFSSHWPYFLALILMGIVVGAIKKVLPRGGRIFITLIDAVLSVAVLILLILSKYQGISLI